MEHHEFFSENLCSIQLTIDDYTDFNKIITNNNIKECMKKPEKEQLEVR